MFIQKAQQSQRENQMKAETKKFVKDYVKFNKNVELESFALGLVDGVKQFEGDEE